MGRDSVRARAMRRRSKGSPWWCGRFELKDVFVAKGKELHAVRVHLVADVGDGRAYGVELAGLDLDGI
jgi:hypothetical protein